MYVCVCELAVSSWLQHVCVCMYIKDGVSEWVSEEGGGADGMEKKPLGVFGQRLTAHPLEGYEKMHYACCLLRALINLIAARRRRERRRKRENAAHLSKRWAFLSIGRGAFFVFCWVIITAGHVRGRVHNNHFFQRRQRSVDTFRMLFISKDIYNVRSRSVVFAMYQHQMEHDATLINIEIQMNADSECTFSFSAIFLTILYIMKYCSQHIRPYFEFRERLLYFHIQFAWREKERKREREKWQKSDVFESE